MNKEQIKAGAIAAASVAAGATLIGGLFMSLLTLLVLPTLICGTVTWAAWNYIVPIFWTAAPHLGFWLCLLGYAALRTVFGLIGTLFRA